MARGPIEGALLAGECCWGQICYEACVRGGLTVGGDRRHIGRGSKGCLFSERKRTGWC